MSALLRTSADSPSRSFKYGRSRSARLCASHPSPRCAEPSRSAVEIDQVADRAWRASRGYLTAYLDLQPEFSPEQAEAQKLVVDYARYLAATVDDEDPETVTAALQALAPIDNLRRMTVTPRASVVKDAPVDPAPSPAPSPDTQR
jgi:hypothetical protein